MNTGLEQTFVIDGRLPGLNDYINAERRNKYLANKMKQTWQSIVIASIRVARIKPQDTPAWITYRFFEPNKRRDKDNISGYAHKVIQDAIVAAGILPDDGWDSVAGYTDFFWTDKARPRVEVKIKTLEDVT